MNEQNGQNIISWPGTQGQISTTPSAPPFAPGVSPPVYTDTRPPIGIVPGSQYANEHAAAADAEAVASAALKAAKEAKKAAKELEKKARERWATPWDRFQAWNTEFGFTLDACADETNHKLPKWLGPNSPLGFLDGLAPNVPLGGERIWCNAPGFDWEWVKWAWQRMAPDRPAHEKPALIVQIRPANQTDQPIWTELVEQYRDWNGYQMLQPLGLDFRVRFLSPRVEHVPPEGIKASSPTSGHCLLIWSNLQAPVASRAL